MYDGSSDFCHLHCHTVFSKLDGVSTPEQLFAKCKERGWGSLAVTEHGSLSSVPDNYIASKESGVKYIVGNEIYYNDYEPLRQRSSKEELSSIRANDKQLWSKIARNRHLTVLAKNEVGIRNLYLLDTEAYFSFYYKHRIWFDKLAASGDGLIILSGCLNGPVSHAIRNGCDDEAVTYIKKFKERWGDDYFIELQMPCLPFFIGQNINGTIIESKIESDQCVNGYRFGDQHVFDRLNQFADEFKIRKVLTNDAHYLAREDFIIQKIMMAVDQGLTIDSEDLFHVNSDEQFFKTRAELYDTFVSKGYDKYASRSDFDMMCDNTLIVAEKCEKYKPNLELKIPSFSDAGNTIRLKAAEGLVSRGLHLCHDKFMVDNRSVTYVEQLKIELDRFAEKGFESYFLITEDWINFSLGNGWMVGSRGSACGSLVCYLLGISHLDPLVWGLSFDRFLSSVRGGQLLNCKLE